MKTILILLFISTTFFAFSQNDEMKITRTEIKDSIASFAVYQRDDMMIFSQILEDNTEKIINYCPQNVCEKYQDLIIKYPELKKEISEQDFNGLFDSTILKQLFN